MASIMRLHLKYRLWIAEMNADINVLRILNDHVVWLKTHNNSKDVERNVLHYEEHFLSLRRDLDELKHEMHITKMKLAAFSKDKQADVQAIKSNIGYTNHKEQYKKFRKRFSFLKREFKKMEAET